MYGLGFAKSRRGPGLPSPMVAQAELASATEQCDEADPREAGWWAVTVSNCRPPGCKPGALPAELTALIRYFLAFPYPLSFSGQHLGQHYARFVAKRVEHDIIARRPGASASLHTHSQLHPDACRW
jgi:hypothetical protein